VVSKTPLIITALFVEGQSPAEVARRYGVHRGWVYKLKARYEAEGQAALQPRSRRPHTSPRATPPATIELVLQLRAQLTADGLDAGVVTLRVNGRLHHIGLGRTHARTPVILLVHDLNVRVIHAATGELLRELTIDPHRDYQPTGRPPGPPPHKHNSRTYKS
jgi:transposase